MGKVIGMPTGNERTFFNSIATEPDVAGDPEWMVVGLTLVGSRASWDLDVCRASKANKQCARTAYRITIGAARVCAGAAGLF